MGGLISRWHGGGFFECPKIFKTMIWACPFGAIVFLYFFRYGLASALVFGVIAFALSGFGKATGHGGGIDLGHNPEQPGSGRKPEKLEYLILWLHGNIPEYWYDLLLLSICGLAAVSGGLLVFFVNPVAGSLFFIGGLMKGASYALGWSLYPEKATETGEFLTGIFAYAALSSALFVLAMA